MLSAPVPRQTPASEKVQGHKLGFPTERDIDDVLEEFGHDSRAAIGALLQDLNALAADQGIARVPEFVPGHQNWRARTPRGAADSSFQARS
jgi:hypothetical protein